MGQVVGIDLGTTNSVIATLDEGQPWAIPDDEGDLLLPSFVGISDGGELLVGQAARRQYAAAPDRTVKSIKRQMGTDFTVTTQRPHLQPPGSIGDYFAIAQNNGPRPCSKPKSPRR